MAIDRSQGGSSLVDVIDRVLDKGIVIDAWVRVSLVGIELVSVEARVVIASVDTYIRYADAISNAPQVAKPRATVSVEEASTGKYEELAAELAGLRTQLMQLNAPPSQPLQPKAAARTRKAAAMVY
jgi:hypothetical protein